MPGAILQLIGVGRFDNYIPNIDTRHALAAMTNTFNNDRCDISRIGDLYTPTKIMCYNCSEDFSINSIKIVIDSRSIIEIDDTKFFDFIGFTENIIIDGICNKVYHLDKTKLFFTIKLIALTGYVSIQITKTGNCDTIKLNGVYDFLDTNVRRQTVLNSHENTIKQMKIGKFENYSSGQVKKLIMDGTVNGFILTDINPNIINSINLKLDGHDRIHYQDKLEIMMNTQRINENTIYINLNDCNYNENVNNSSLNTSSNIFNNITLKLGLDEGIDNITFKIGCYSNNILRIISGCAGVLFDFTHYIFVNDYVETSINQSRYNNISQPWAKKPKLIEGDTLCPVIYEEIEGDYICCQQCKKNFDYSIIDTWIKPNKTCPLCRITWSDFTIYENMETNNVIHTIQEV